jgi:spermidine synthase
MLGLSAGAFVFGKLSDRFNPFTVLFALETMIALTSTFIVQLARSLQFDGYLLVLFSFLVPLLPAFLMGGELPAAIKIVSSRKDIGEASGYCYSLDTAGGIAGALIAGMFLIPAIGSLKTVLVAGFLNAAGAICVLFALKSCASFSATSASACSVAPSRSSSMRIKFSRSFGYVAVLLLFLALIASWYAAQKLEFSTASGLYEGSLLLEVVHSKYQTISVVYHPILGISLFLDGSLQISEASDEPYSESLVLPATVTLLAHSKPIDVLIIGGGDLGVVEVLTRFPEDCVRSITLVDLDPEVIDVSKKYLRAIHEDSWKDPRFEYVEMDCRAYIQKTDRKFDLVIVDLPDPENDIISTLYSLEFYNSVYAVLDEDGIMVTQATSADYAFGADAYAVIVKTLEASDFPIVRPYVKYVPGFGMWGFVIASKKYDPLAIDEDEIADLLRETDVEVNTYNEDVHFALFSLPPWLEEKIDEVGKAGKINTLDKPVLLYV